MFTLLLIGWISGNNATFTETGAEYEPDRIRAGRVLTPEDLATSPDLGANAAIPANRVFLTTDGVEMARIRPCAAGEGLVVKAEFNEKRFDFSETLVEEADGSWAYSIEMTRHGSGLVSLVERIFTGRESTLELCLPSEVPIEVTVDTKRVGLEAEFGGLWLPKLDIVLDRGGGFVSIDEPFRVPAQSVSIRANMGGAVITGLGNASPAELNLDYRFGGFNIEMTGAWKRDALITMTGTTSGVSLTLPRSVRVEGVPDLLESSAGEGAPTLTFAEGVNWKDVEVSFE
jgi:hypothetical protein